MLHIHVYYEVKFGDTMLDICNKFGVNFVILLALNPVYTLAGGGRDPNNIKMGELIRIQ